MVECALPVAAGVVIVSLLGYALLWIASGLPQSIETAICLMVGMLTAVVAAPPEAANVADTMQYGLVAGVVVAALVGRWRPNVMFTRAATHGLGYAGVLILLAPFIANAPDGPTGDLSTGQYVIAEVVSAISSGVLTIATGFGFGCG